jgi:hypothetical protein
MRSVRLAIPLLLPTLLACQTEAPVEKAEVPQVKSLEAVVEIDPSSSAKRFQGVWLVPDQGPRLLIAYRKDPLWADFAGKRVEVEIERYTPPPEQQAIEAPHARVLKLSVEPELMTDLVEIGAEETFAGKLQTRTGEPGTKLEGQPWTVLVTDKGEFLLANLTDAPRDTALEVRARKVTRSPMVAHMTGPTLWLLSAKPR